MLEGSQPSGPLNDGRTLPSVLILSWRKGMTTQLPQMHDDDLDQAVDEGENADLSSAKDQLLRLSQ